MQQKKLGNMQALQQELQMQIQRAINQSAALTQERTEGTMKGLVDNSHAVQSQLDKLQPSTVLALSLEQLSEVFDHACCCDKRWGQPVAPTGQRGPSSLCFVTLQSLHREPLCMCTGVFEL
jgi:hypothetical protein